MPNWIEHKRYSIFAEQTSELKVAKTQINHDDFIKKLDEAMSFATQNQYSITGIIPIVQTIVWSESGLTKNDTTGAHILMQRTVEISQEEYDKRESYIKLKSRHEKLTNKEKKLQLEEDQLKNGEVLCNMLERLGLQTGEDIQDFLTSDRFLREEKGLFGTKYSLGRNTYSTLEDARRGQEACRKAISHDYQQLVATREKLAACIAERQELEEHLVDVMLDIEDMK